MDEVRFVEEAPRAEMPCGCHFDEGQAPKMIRLHFVRDELLAV
jgi:hypothetical protein